MDEELQLSHRDRPAISVQPGETTTETSKISTAEATSVIREKSKVDISADADDRKRRCPAETVSKQQGATNKRFRSDIENSSPRSGIDDVHTKPSPGDDSVAMVDIGPSGVVEVKEESSPNSPQVLQSIEQEESEQNSTTVFSQDTLLSAIDTTAQACDHEATEIDLEAAIDTDNDLQSVTRHPESTLQENRSIDLKAEEERAVPTKVKQAPKKMPTKSFKNTGSRGNGSERRYRAAGKTRSSEVIVACVDFGCTGSGLAWASAKSSPGNVTNINAWPDLNGIRDKLPTEIAFKAENREHHAFEGDADHLIGFSVQQYDQAGEAQLKKHSLIKAAIEKQRPVGPFDDPILVEANLQQYPTNADRKEGQQAIVQFLKGLHHILMENIQDKIPADDLQWRSFRYVMTHPAAYDDESKKDLQRLVEQAAWMREGSKDEIVLRSEAEAAATRAFVLPTECGSSTMWEQARSAKEPILVFDIGGLTCDAATLIVEKTKPNIKLRETCVNEGGKCGTFAIFFRVRQWVTEHLKKSANPQHLRENALGPNGVFRNSVDMALINCGDHSKKKWHRLIIRGERLQNNQFLNREVMLPTSELTNIMDATIEKMKAVMENQMIAAKKECNKSPKVIVLCGGGAHIPYIKQQLRAYCENRENGKASLVVPDAPQAAVVVGGLISGMINRPVAIRQSRYGYGIRTDCSIESAGPDPPSENKYTDRFGHERFNGRMMWHINRGDEINVADLKASNKFEVDIALVPADLKKGVKKRISIYTNDCETPPMWDNNPRVKRSFGLSLEPSKMAPATKRSIREEWEMSKKPLLVPIQIAQQMSNTNGVLKFKILNDNGRSAIFELEVNFDMFG